MFSKANRSIGNVPRKSAFSSTYDQSAIHLNHLGNRKKRRVVDSRGRVAIDGGKKIEKIHGRSARKTVLERVDILEAGVSSGLTNRGRDAYEITTVSFLVLRSFLPASWLVPHLPSFTHDEGVKKVRRRRQIGSYIFGENHS